MRVSQGLLAAYVDLCRAFHSIYRDALWRNLGLHGVPLKLINLMPEQYSGTDSAVIVVIFPSLKYLQLLLEFARNVCWLPHFSTLAWTCILGRISEKSSCVALIGSVKISDLDFVDDAVIFAETLHIFLGALKVLNEESEPLGLRVSLVKSNIQAFTEFFGAAILSAPVCGEDVEVTERFTCIGSDILVSTGCELEVNRQWVGLGESCIHWILGCGAVGTCAAG